MVVGAMLVVAASWPAGALGEDSAADGPSLSEARAAAGRRRRGGRALAAARRSRAWKGVPKFSPAARRHLVSCAG